MGDNASPLLKQVDKDTEIALEINPYESKEPSTRFRATQLAFLWLLEIVWNIIGIILIASHRKNQLYFLLIILLIFFGVCPCLIFTHLRQFGLPKDFLLKQAFNLFGSLTITSLLIYDAYYFTDTTEYYGTNFTLAYSYGFVIFSALSFAYIKTEFFSISDFMMRIQFAKYTATILDAFSLAQMLSDRPWDNLSISVFSFFIIANSTVVLTWITFISQLRISMKYEFDDRRAKSFRKNLLSQTMIYIDIPFLVIRLVGYFNFGISVSSFAAKNVINILASCKEIYTLNKFKKKQHFIL